jgi:hypothetical protein
MIFKFIIKDTLEFKYSRCLINLNLVPEIKGTRLNELNFCLLTLSDPMPDLVRHYDFPVPDDFLDL